MDLSTTPRRATEGVGDLQKTRVAKSVFSIRSLVDVEETELPAQEDERSPSESLNGPLEFFIICAPIETIITSVNSRFEITFLLISNKYIYLRNKLLLWNSPLR